MTISKSVNNARQGENSGRMPIVLGLSLLLIVIVFAGEFGFTQMFPAKHSQIAQKSGAAQ